MRLSSPRQPSRRGPGRGVGLGNWRIWVWPAAIALVVGISGAAWLGWFTTSGPSFCLSCHGQGDTPDMGHPSLVHPPFSKVGCTECHAEPGQMIITHLYQDGVEATWERVSGNCVRCHGDILDKEVADFESNLMNISIPHRLHVEEFDILCSNCHRNVAHDWGVPQTNRPRMQYCYQCHTEQEGCLTCHPGGIPPGPLPLLPVAEPSRAPKVPHVMEGRSDCLLCHNADGLRPLPSTHEGRRPDLCRSCHEISVSVAVGTASTPPQIPHSVERRENCLLCHGSSGLKPAPEGHAGRTNEICRLCHKPGAVVTSPEPPQIPHTLTGRSDCLLCHGPTGFKPLPASHERRTLDMCPVCHEAGG